MNGWSMRLLVAAFGGWLGTSWAEALPPTSSGSAAQLSGAGDSPVALHWEPVTGTSSYWVSASGAAAIDKLGASRLSLGPDAEARLLLPAFGWLRIQGAASSPAPRVNVSGGTGLAIEATLIPGTDGRSWLLRTELPQPVVVHLRPAPDERRVRTYGLYVPRRDMAPSYAVAGEPIGMPGPVATVRQADEGGGEPHVLLEAGRPIELTLQGPARLRLDARLDGTADPAQSILTWAAALGGQARELTLQRLPSGPELRAPVAVNGAWQPVGRLERFEFEVPKGEHRVTLTPSHSVLARLGKLEAPHLLLSANAPSMWSQALLPQQETPWVQDAIAAAVANRWRQAGTTAIQRLHSAAQERPHRADLAALASELDGVIGQWHAIPPADPVGSSDRASLSPAVLAAATISATPKDPLQKDQAALRDSGGGQRALSQTLFHRVTSRGTRFDMPLVRGPQRMRLRVLDAASSMAMLELRDDTGRQWRVHAGAQVLDRGQLSTPDLPIAGPGTDPGLDVPALPSVALESGEVQWWLPAGVSHLFVRALQGQAMVALDWRGSGEVGLDDGLGAALATGVIGGRPAGSPGGQPHAAMAQDAWRPVERLMQAALAQLSASTVPARSPVTLSAAESSRIASLARNQREPAAALPHWHALLGAPDSRLKSEALRGMVSALRAGGERFLAEQLLRSHWLGNDPVLSAAALIEMQSLHIEERDEQASLLLAAAAVAREPGRVGDLAVELSRAGDDRLALVAALAAPQPPDLKQKELTTALLSSALRLGLPATFDALVAALSGREATAYWRGQWALHQGDTASAIAAFEQGSQPDWARHVARGHSIAGRLASEPSASAVQDWLSWQSTHPGPRQWRSDTASVVSHGGGMVLRSIARDLRSTWWQAHEQRPTVIRVVGPARVRIEARPLHHATDELLDGWLRIEGEGQLWLQPYSRNGVSPGLEVDSGPSRDIRVGARIERIIDIPSGLHQLRIHAAAQPIVVRYDIERPPLQGSRLLPAPAPAFFAPMQSPKFQAVAAPACGLRGSCAVEIVDGKLRAFRILTSSQNLPGLPTPPAERDVAAARLGSGDLWGSVEQATNPADKMRTLAWIAETRPSDHQRALARAAALRGRTTEADLQEAWQRLEQASQWVHQPLVTQSAGLRAVPSAPGHAQAPAARLRASLLDPLKPDELRLAGDARAVFAITDPAASRTVVHLRAEDLPGLRPQRLSAQIMVDGREVRRVELPSPGAVSSVTVDAPSGEHSISVGAVDSYANQGLRVRFEHSGPAVPQLYRDWQIASRAQPVRIAVAAPAWLRIDRLTKAGDIDSEERFIDGSAVQTVSLGPAGEAEALYRVYVRQPMPAPPARPPRPILYQTEPVPELPASWAAADFGAGTRAVGFTYAVPVERLLDFTWTPRLAARQRRDTDATGGAELTNYERFLEAGASWMQRSADGEHWRMADAFARAHARGSPVIGLRLAATQSLGWSPVLPFPVDAGVSAFSAAQSTPAGLAASVQLDASLAQSRRLAPSLTHRPQLAAFVRASSLRDVDAQSLDRVDTDVYSRYRQQHRFGLALGDTMTWQPRRDTELSMRARIVSNENLTADHARMEVQVQQLAGSWLLGAGVRHTRYLEDRHRARAVGITEPELNVQRDMWQVDGRRLALRFTARRNSLSGALTTGIELEWHQSAGRRLWDSGPGDRDFSALREWRIRPAPNRVEDIR